MGEWLGSSVLENETQEHGEISTRLSCGRAWVLKKLNIGVPIVAQWLTNPTRNHKVAGSIPGLAQWVKDLVLP